MVAYTVTQSLVSFLCDWKAKIVIWKSLNLHFIVATFDSPPWVIVLLKQAATDLMFYLIIISNFFGVVINKFLN